MANIRYKVHVQDEGWQDWKYDGQIAGTTGQNKQIESIMVEPLIEGVELEYTPYVENFGWMKSYTSPHSAGTMGENRAIEAIQFKILGDAANQWDLWYRVHIQDYGYLDWVYAPDGIAGSMEGNKQIEAIQLYLVPKNSMYLASDSADNFLSFERPKPAPEPPPQPPAPPIDYRAAVLNAARGYLGYVSGTSEDSAFGRRYGSTGSWCAFFVRACCEDAGLNFPNTGYCPTLVDWAKQNGRWTGVPEPGFIAMYDFSGNGISDHTGIVEQVFASNHIIAIEGNTSGSRGIGVYRKDRSWGILGYINPF